MKIFPSVLLLLLLLSTSSAPAAPRDCKPIRANRAKAIVLNSDRLRFIDWAPGDTTLVHTTRDGVYNLAVVRGDTISTLYVTARGRPLYAVATRGQEIVAPYIVYGRNDEVWTDTLNAPGSGGHRQEYFDGLFMSRNVRSTTDAAGRLLRYYRRSGVDSVYLRRRPNGVPEVLTLYDTYGSDSLTRYWNEEGILALRRAARGHDERTYYPDGVLQTHRYDTSGPLGYCHKAYHSAGALQLVAFFQEGEPAGLWRHYGEDGHLLRTERMKRTIDSGKYYMVEAAPPPPEIYTYVEQRAEAPANFREQLTQQLEQVLCRSRKPLDGRYTMTCIIDEAGKIRMIGAEGSNVADITPELKAVFAWLPAWRPARIIGRPVRSKMTMDFVVK